MASPVRLPLHWSALSSELVIATAVVVLAGGVFLGRDLLPLLNALLSS